MNTEVNKQLASPHSPAWHGWVIMGTAGVLGLTILAALGLIFWNVNILANIIAGHQADKAVFAFTSMGLLGQVLLRILAIFFGAATMLAGTATAFYSIGDRTSASGEGIGGIKFALATASPGIAAVFAGALVVCVAVGADFKSSYAGEVGSPSAAASRAKSVEFVDSDEILKGKPKGAEPSK